MFTFLSNQLLSNSERVSLLSGPWSLKDFIPSLLRLVNQFMVLLKAYMLVLNNKNLWLWALGKVINATEYLRSYNNNKTKP